MSEILVYYFAFPHYRQQILEELARQYPGRITIAAGVRSRGDIKPITRMELESLCELETISLGPISWQRGIVRKAILKGYDAVILGPAVLSLSTWSILCGRRLLGRRTYLWGLCGRRGDRSIKRFAQEIMNSLAHGLLVYGNAEAAGAQELGRSRKKVRMVGNATHSNLPYVGSEIDQLIFRTLRQRTKEASGEGRLVLTYVGRLLDYKRIPVLVSAARKLQDKYPAIELRIVGGGAAEQSLRERCHDPFVRFCGEIYDVDILNRIISESTLIVSPYDMGLVAIDALRAGVPVLVPDNRDNGSEVEALSEGINAVRFTPESDEAIVDAVERWFGIATRVSEFEYTKSRNDALRAWSPIGVARRLLDAIDSEQ